MSFKEKYFASEKHKRLFHAEIVYKADTIAGIVCETQGEFNQPLFHLWVCFYQGNSNWERVHQGVTGVSSIGDSLSSAVAYTQKRHE